MPDHLRQGGGTVPGGYKPAVSTLTLELVLRGVRERLTLPFGGDPQRLADELKTVLGPAGAVVELRTERSRRDRPRPHSVWISGGSASAGSGGAADPGLPVALPGRAC
ncbi:hypothetical protein ACIPW5_04235 [Streptomyces sp. NPDC090077]|uniref:hypothetical protein n=1 Tax=Streptomyces sp. NPDC090077 TaxID=3365938 RepID=UPI003819790A